MLLTTLLVFAFALGGSGPDKQVVRFPGYCAVDVHLADESGKPLAASVELFGPDGQRVSKATADQSGIVNFCDFGFGTHRILVGGETCNPVVIENVRILYPHASTYYVTLNRCAPLKQEEGSTCAVVVRARNAAGGPIPTAEATFDGRERVHADGLGRALLRLPIGTSGTLKVSAPGYSDQTGTLRCDKTGARIEQAFSLRPIGSPQETTEPLCAVTVRITDERGRPTVNVVDLITASGLPVSRTYSDRNGIARFCDLGPGQFTLRVGGTTCNAVEIRGVRDPYPEVNNYSVTLTTCREGGDRFNACSLYFRVSSETGDPLRATVRRDSDVAGQLTDEYGRAYELLEYGQQATFIFTAGGYAERKLILDCDGRQQRDERVVLKRLKP